ncbi:MAG: DUF11 domain-containing protein [Proteobacteria bacterium]|nr:DUF11 domain-containing protein [Pseudomonadota bacterium]
MATSAVRADDDGRFIGRSIDLVDKTRVDSNYQAPPVRPAPQPAPRPVPLVVQATQVSAESRGTNVRLVKQMPGEVNFGQEFMYQLQVYANENVADVIVRDTVPEGAVYIRSEPPAKVTGNLLEWNLNEMDAGQVREIRVWLRPEREGRLGSCATVHALSRVCAFTMVGRATLAITKTGPATAVLGDDIGYNIVVSNSGTAVARGVVVTDTIPDGLTHASGQSTLTFNVGDLGPTQSRTINVPLKGTKRGRFVNAAVATSTNAGKVNAEAATTIFQPGLQITKTGPQEQYIGKSADYTITLNNIGDTTLNNVVITDNAPQVTRIIAAPGATVAGTQAIWRLPELGAGEKKTFSLTLTTATAGTHANTVAAVAGGLKADAQAATIWRGVGGMLVEAVDDPDPILVGGTTTYTVRITNQGSGDLININTVGQFPKELTPLAAEGGTVSGQSVRFQTVARLASKQSVQFKVTARGASEGDARVKFIFTEDSLTAPVIKEESTRVF